MTGSEKQVKNNTTPEKTYWFSPESMLQTESKVRSLENADFSEMGDFGSYRALRERKSKTNIALHNSTGEHATAMAKILTRFIRKLSTNTLTIADMGCGAGFIAEKMKSYFPESNIFGFDLATDAIEYAKENFSGINFRCCAIEASTNFPEIYSVIYAHEFYPFTRTNDFNLQAGYVQNFLKHLIYPGGLLLIGLRISDESLYHKLDMLRKTLKPEIQLRAHYIPIKKIHNLVKFFGLSTFLSRLLNFALRRPNSVIISIRT